MKKNQYFSLIFKKWLFNTSNLILRAIIETIDVLKIYLKGLRKGMQLLSLIKYSVFHCFDDYTFLCLYRHFYRLLRQSNCHSTACNGFPKRHIVNLHKDNIFKKGRSKIKIFFKYLLLYFWSTFLDCVVDIEIFAMNLLYFLS